MAQYPTEFADQLEFLMPETGLGERADEALEQLHQRGMVAAARLTLFHAGTTAAMSGESHIVEFCPSDPGRFGSEGLARTWNAKGGGRGLVGIYDVVGNDGNPLPDNVLTSLTDDRVRQLAYGWSGQEINKHIPGADITTAYRVGLAGQRLARERRYGEGDRFSLGMPLGELVIATAVHLHGADPAKISLETWRSNTKAVELYERLGFRFRKSVPDERLTQHPVGAVINGNPVYVSESDKNAVKNVVQDIREHRVLEQHPLVAA